MLMYILLLLALLMPSMAMVVLQHEVWFVWRIVVYAVNLIILVWVDLYARDKFNLSIGENAANLSHTVYKTVLTIVVGVCLCVEGREYYIVTDTFDSDKYSIYLLFAGTFFGSFVSYLHLTTQERFEEVKKYIEERNNA